jgi:hypothetical protein
VAIRLDVADLLRSSRCALVFTTLFVVASSVVDALDPVRHTAVLAWASTDLVNLGSHPVGALVASAFLAETDVASLAALAVIGLVAAGQALGPLRLALLVTVTHVVATLVSEGVLAHQVAIGVLAPDQRLIVDIGPSYVIAPALAVGIVYGRWPGRIASLVGFVAFAPHLFGGLFHLEVGAVGHTTAILVGLLLAWPLRRSRRRRTRPGQ